MKTKCADKKPRFGYLFEFNKTALHWRHCLRVCLRLLPSVICQ